MDDLINRQDAIDIIYAESRLANSEVAEEYAEMYAYALRGVAIRTARTQNSLLDERYCWISHLFQMRWHQKR